MPKEVDRLKDKAMLTIVGCNNHFAGFDPATSQETITRTSITIKSSLTTRTSKIKGMVAGQEVTVLDVLPLRRLRR
jgi:hypothetical protein